MSVEFRLTHWEFKRCIEVAAMRFAWSESNRFNNASTATRSWMSRMFHEINGACGECGTARVLDRNWCPLEELNRFHRVADIGDDIEVRTTHLPNGKLTMYPSDDPDRFYVLVTGEPPVMTIRGYILGADGFRDEWLYPKPENRKTWLVPQDALITDLDSLKRSQAIATGVS